MVGLPFAGNGLVHGLLMALGILAGLGLFAYELRRQGIKDDRLWIVAGTSLAFGGVASRLGTWFQYLDLSQNEPVLAWWADGNRSVLAGLLGAWLGVHVGKLISGYRESTGDLFAPSVALAMAIGRVGCLLTEAPGRPTGGSWGIVVKPEQADVIGGPAGVGLHPSFAYEIVFQAAAFAWLRRFRGRLPKSGDLFIAYVTGYALFRFAVEFVRANEQVWYGLTRPQWFLLCTLPLLVWRTSRIWRRPAPVKAVPAMNGGSHD